MHPTTRRAGQVAVVCLRHAVAVTAEVLHLRRRAAPGPAGPVHLRRALEELGPTFMKLGQVLSTRPDLVPPAYERELARLQDSAPTVPISEITRAVEAALGCPRREAFVDFDVTPIAAASIGQVHAATLPGGEDVVVKVRRPGVIDQIAVDLELLARVAAIAARWSRLRRYDPVGLAREFNDTLRAELDYPREGRNAELIAAEFATNPRVHVPAVFWDHTAEGIITEERIRGIKVDDIAALDRAGIDRSQVARAFADAYLTMVFVHGFFHADPHPGNVFVESVDGIGFVDFGMMGAVSARTGHGLGAILLAVIGTDPAQMADGLLRLGVASDDVDRSSFERDLAALLEEYAGLPLEQLHIAPLLGEVMRVVRDHHLRLPSDLALLLKTVMMCEGVAAYLDPGFELVPLLIPYAARLADAPSEVNPNTQQ